MTRHVVAAVDEIPPGSRKRISAGGRDIVVFNIAGEFFALLDRCPHEGASLCAGKLVGLMEGDVPGAYRLTRAGEILRCPWHGWEFDVRTGRSVSDPKRLRVNAYASTIAHAAELEEVLIAETFAIEVDQSYVVVTV